MDVSDHEKRRRERIAANRMALAKLCVRQCCESVVVLVTGVLVRVFGGHRQRGADGRLEGAVFARCCDEEEGRKGEGIDVKEEGGNGAAGGQSLYSHRQPAVDVVSCSAQ